MIGNGLAVGSSPLPAFVGPRRNRRGQLDSAVGSVVLNGAYRQYTGHPAGLTGAAQADPLETFMPAPAR